MQLMMFYTISNNIPSFVVVVWLLVVMVLMVVVVVGIGRDFWRSSGCGGVDGCLKGGSYE